MPAAQQPAPMPPKEKPAATKGHGLLSTRAYTRSYHIQKATAQPQETQTHRTCVNPRQPTPAWHRPKPRKDTWTHTGGPRWPSPKPSPAPLRGSRPQQRNAHLERMGIQKQQEEDRKELQNTRHRQHSTRVGRGRHCWRNSCTRCRVPHEPCRCRRARSRSTLLGEERRHGHYQNISTTFSKHGPLAQVLNCLHSRDGTVLHRMKQRSR
jgi:hypothetical protein